MRVQTPSDDVVAGDVLALYRRHLGSGRAALGSMIGGITEVTTGGAWIVAAGGRRYLDFGGYGVFLLGHRHPRVVAEVRRQLGTRPLASRVFLDPVMARAASALAEVAPAGLDCVHFVNSGAEATEAALKLARANGRNAIVTTRNGFHGKTMGALSVTANPLYQQPFAPLLPETVAVGYGDLAEMRDALAARAGRACVIVEPVQGEGGVVIPPPGYLRGVVEACREYGAVLVVDEIQTGMGRLGTWWGLDPDGITPDMLLVGKGLSGGVVPVAALLARPQVYAPFGRDPFLHSSTFGGSPLACAAAYGAIRATIEEDIVARCAALGERLLAGVRAACVAAGAGVVAEVRGRGLLIGVECRRQADVGELILALLGGGVLVNHSLNASKVLRLTPPAIIDEAELDLFLGTFAEALAAVAARA
jgi:putrescine aminotransferase